MGRDAVGVRGIRLREGDYVVGAARAKPNHEVLSITENGYGKRTPVEDYRITNRGGLGIKNYMLTDKTCLLYTSTSDRPPSEMTQLEDRLRTRFEWGLLVDVAPPEFETRLAIVKYKAALLGLSCV